MPTAGRIQIIIDGGKANGIPGNNSECRAQQPAVQLIRSYKRTFLCELH